MRYTPNGNEETKFIIDNFPIVAVERLRYARIRVDDTYDFQYDRAYAAVGHLLIEYVPTTRWYVVGDARVFWLFDAYDLWPNGDISSPARVRVWMQDGWYFTDEVPNKSFTPIAKR